MRILFAGNKERGALCLKALLDKDLQVVGVIAHAPKGALPAKGGLKEIATSWRLPFFEPLNVNDPHLIQELRTLKPDVTILAGYGPIVRREFIDLAPKGCINLHGGKLPQRRGSSPMNWALINGAKEFTLSVIQVDHGVDSGNVLLDRSFKIQPSDTIADLDRKANEEFPKMLIQVMNRIAKGRLKGRKQKTADSAYYPLRFPEDGFIVWDLYTAKQIHNRIRALTHPYPGAYTYYQRRKVCLLASHLTEQPFFGEPGRIYRITETSLLIAAADQALWIDNPTFEDSGETVTRAVSRYEQLPTMRSAVAMIYGPGSKL